MSVAALLAQQGQKQREEIFREQNGALGCGVDAVGLDRSGHGVDVRVKHGQKRDVIARRDLVIHEVELMDVGLAVVGREGDAGEQNPGMCGEQARDDDFKIALGDGERKAAETVVATELNHDDGGVHGENEREAVDAILGGVAADAGVDDAVVVATGVEIFLERGGPCLAGFETVPGGDAVSIADDDGLFRISGARRKRKECGYEWQEQYEGHAAVHSSSLAMR